MMASPARARAREFVALGGDHLDVEREPPHVAEAHAAEGTCVAREQVGARGRRGTDTARWPGSGARRSPRGSGRGRRALPARRRSAPPPEVARPPTARSRPRPRSRAAACRRRRRKGVKGALSATVTPFRGGRHACPPVGGEREATRAGVRSTRRGEECSCSGGGVLDGGLVRRVVGRGRPRGRPVSGTMTVGIERTPCSLTPARIAPTVCRPRPDSMSAVKSPCRARPRHDAGHDAGSAMFTTG